MKRICSDKHFSRLLITFKKIAIKQAGNHISLNNNLIASYIMYDDGRLFDFDCNLLEKKFRFNPYKTHSCIDDTIMHPLVNKFWVSYTVEDTNNKRCKKTDSFNDKNLVFRLYLKIGNYRKKRIARWIVPMNWHNK